MKTKKKHFRLLSIFGLLITLVLSSITNVFGSTLVPNNLEWNTFLGADLEDTFSKMEIDGEDNIFVAGRSYSTWGSPVSSYTGSDDISVAKLDNDGNLLWNTFLGSSNRDGADRMTLDEFGDVYVSGISRANWGSPIVNHHGSEDNFVAKLDGDTGVLIWNTFLGSSSNDYAATLVVDNTGDIYVSGDSFASWGSPLNPFSGGRDTFVAKLDNDGVLQWNTFFGSGGSDYHKGISEKNGYLYISGRSSAPWGSPINPHGGGEDAYAAKLDNNGNLIWNTFMGAGGRDTGSRILSDGNGNVYVGGDSSASWGTPLNPYSGGYDAFVAQLDESGNLNWNTFLGGSDNEGAAGLAFDSTGDLYLYGYYAYSTWGDPLNPYSGGGDILLAKMASNGTVEWHTFYGSDNQDLCVSIDIDSNGDILFAGHSESTWGDPLSPHSGGRDGFVAKMVLNSPPEVDLPASHSGYMVESIELSPTVIDPDGDELTYEWTYSPHSDLNLCKFSDPYNATTSITCLTDRVFSANLTISDGINEVTVQTNLNVSVRTQTPQDRMYYVSHGAGSEFYYQDAGGTPVQLTHNTVAEGTFDVSPTYPEVVYDRATTEFVIADSEQGDVLQRVIHSGYYIVQPQFSHDGEHIVYRKGSSSNGNLYILPRTASAGDTPFALDTDCGSPESPGWSPMDDMIAYSHPLPGVCSGGWPDQYLTVIDINGHNKQTILDDKGNPIVAGTNGHIYWKTSDDGTHRMVFMQQDPIARYQKMIMATVNLEDYTATWEVIAATADPYRGMYIGDWDNQGRIWYNTRDWNYKTRVCYFNPDIEGSHFCESVNYSGEKMRPHYAPIRHKPLVEAGGPYEGLVGEEIPLLGSASDPDEDPLVIEWTYTPDNGGCAFGDASQPETTFTCTEPGTYEVTLSADDGFFDPVIDSAEVTVINQPPVVDAGGPYDVSENNTLALTPTVNDPEGDSMTYMWSYAPEDGTCSFDDATLLNASITCTQRGAYTLTLEVEDGYNTANDTAGLTVVNLPPEVVVPGVSGVEGSPIAVIATVTDLEGDMLSYLWNYLPADDVCAFTDPTDKDTSFTCQDDGEYEVILTVSDGINDPVLVSAAASIENVAPELGAITTTIDPVQVGVEIIASAPFSDPGTLDTHLSMWYWGDGNSTAGLVENYTTSGSYSYDTPGVYTLTVEVEDDDGGWDDETYQYVVVYDPSSGFVTGGGWIDSPAGAYVADSSLTGKATFGFVSKYKKGADVPTGVTEFHFRVADLNFHSDSYEWLVVAGKKAIYKGEGTINGEGNYGFMLSCIDGDLKGGDGVDRFRIKIWDKATDQLVYDNQMGEVDDAEPATELGGGSIVIHKAK